MAVKKPLVLGSNGLIQQLQAADSISVSSAALSTYSATNGEAGSVVIGAPVYSFGAGSIKKAQANGAATAEVLGLVADATIATATIGTIALSGLLSATTGQWDAVVTGAAGGLVFGTKYFLDPSTAGKLTTTPPTTVGQYLVYIGTAFSTTEMMLDPGEAILL
jgi:hypothetical protein